MLLVLAFVLDQRRPCRRRQQPQLTLSRCLVCLPCVQHNKKREELQRLQEKYPEQAAKLARVRRLIGMPRPQPRLCSPCLAGCQL